MIADENEVLEPGHAWAFSDFAKWKRNRECIIATIPPPAAIWRALDFQAACADLSVLRWIAAGSPVPGVFLGRQGDALTVAQIAEMVGSASARATFSRLTDLGVIDMFRIPAVAEKVKRTAVDVVDEDPDYPVFPLRGGKGWLLKDSDISMLAGAYPNVDIQAEARKAHAWLWANPERRKSAGGMLKFLRGWVERASRRVAPRPQGGYAARPNARPEYDPDLVVVPPDEAFLSGD